MPLQAVPLPPACAPFDSSSYFTYGYLPTLSTGIIFTIIFGLISCTQLYFMIRYRSWWMFFFVVGAGLDCLGWIGRTIAHECPFSNPISTMQVATLIMGPAWTQAGVYIALWVMIQILGRYVSPLPPQVYLWVCVSVDTVCLTLQATGGGIAGGAVNAGNSPHTGTLIMLAGIVAQLVCGCVFFVLLVLVLYRGRKDILRKRPVFLVSFAVTISTLMMILRGFYRSVELAQGWTGFLITHQPFIIGLDAVPMVIAMGTLAIFSPGKLLWKHRRAEAAAAEKADRESQGSDSSTGGPELESREK